MKTLQIHRDEKKDRPTVDCAMGVIPVHSRCAYCAHCRGVRAGPRIYPVPQEKALQGGGGDEALMNAAMQFNTLIRDASAIECDDDSGEGFRTRYRH